MNLDFRNIASKLSIKGWLAVGGAALVGVAFMALLFSFASAPSYTTLVAGVTPSQAGKITDALSTSGISYKLANSGTAVSVSSSEVSKARVVLDTQGLATGSSSTLESLMGKSPLGESSSQQQTQLTSALETQLEQKLEAMSGINSAQVTLAIPSDTSTLFSSTSSSPSASVLLNTNSTLSTATVSSIASIVANSVSGLKTSSVSITDQDGDALWPNNSSSSATTKQSAEQAYDQWAAERATALLSATVGSGNAIVQVASDVDANKVSLQSLSYSGKTVPLTSTSSDETLTSANGSTSTTGNTTASYAGTTGSGPSKYRNTSTTATNGATKTVTQETVAPGAINGQTIAVMISSKVPASELPALEQSVKNSLGFTAGRDKISIVSVPFAASTTKAAAAGASTSKLLGYAKYLLLGIAAILFLFFISRLLRRREQELIAGHPTWLREYEQPRALSEVSGQRSLVHTPEPQINELRPPVNVARRQIEDLVDRDPERVASQVRQWLSED